MRNGDNESAVRIIPPAGAPPTGSRTPKPRRKWLVPVLVIGVFGVLFVSATRPSGSGNEPTTPARLSAVGDEVIDLTPPGDTGATAEWDQPEFRWSGEIKDLTSNRSSFIAVGEANGEARAWLSGVGTSWRRVESFQVPDAESSSIDHVVWWNGSIIALGAVDDGVGLWTGRGISNWDYQGAVAGMEGTQLVGLAGNESLLAIATLAGKYRGWTSSDGLLWEPIDALAGLDGLVIETLSATGEVFFATGQEDCETPPCNSVIYRSVDGVRWAPTQVVQPGPSNGKVVALTTTSNGLVAVGESAAGVAVWQSAEGDRWSRVAVNDPALRSQTAVLRLGRIDTEEQSVAYVTINDEPVQLIVGSEVLTNAGALRVTEVEADHMAIEWAAGATDIVFPGMTSTLTLRGIPHDIGAQGPRLVIAGEVEAGHGPIPAAWSSADAGQTWELEIVDPWREGAMRAAAVNGLHVLATGETQEAEPLIWHTTWDTTGIEAQAIQTAEEFFASVNAGDFVRTMELLPRQRHASSYGLPTLGGSDLEWRDEATGTLQLDSVTDTLGYLDALNTAVSLSECSTRASLDELNTVTVSCDFVATSDLLQAYAPNSTDGHAQIVVAADTISRIHLSVDPSVNIWRTLRTGIAAEDRATLETTDVDGNTSFQLTLTPESATTHLRLFEEFFAGLLMPGDTRVVETSLGTMEWTWLDPAPVPVASLRWVLLDEDGFLALGEGEPGSWTGESSLWSSSDGIAWQQQALGFDAHNLWQPTQFRDGWVAQAWQEGGKRVLVYFDGSAWSEIDLPEAPEGWFLEVTNLAASGDLLLLTTVQWSEADSDPPESDAWLLDGDGALRRVELPAGTDEHATSLVGTEEGFLLASARFASPENLTVWRSLDGFTWTQLGDASGLEGAQTVWVFQQHRGRLFAAGERAGMNHCHTPAADPDCRHVLATWSSLDGQQWEPVLTSTGEPVSAFEIGSGSLGLVGAAVDWSGQLFPRSLYLSGDGETWEAVGSLLLVHPDADWWWTGRPAVGDDTIVIPGSSFDPTAGENDEIPFLIVGRLVDG